MRREDGPETRLDARSWTELREAVARFRAALRRGDRPSIKSYLPADRSLRATVLIDLIHEEMEFRIEAGEWPGLAAYLERWPDVAADPGRVGELEQAETELRHTGPGGRSPGFRPEGIRTPGREPEPTRIGRYELREVIGRGAFGVVHRAYDTALRRVVALKRPGPGAVGTPEAIERFVREARAVAGLRHPHIVALHDAGQADGVPYLVSTLVEGRNLADELAAGRPDLAKAAGWVAVLAEALDHAHGLGVVHRDVKPSNILIDAEDRAHLTDFGMARNGGGDATLTADGQVIGTPAYIAPEQVRGERGRVDARSDIYSLGVILYELLTGVRPFAASGRLLLVQIEDEEPRPPRRVDERIPRDLEMVCLKAMAKESGHRYPTAAALAADLGRWLRGEPVQARPVGRAGALWRRCRRRPIVAGLVASLILAASAGCAGVIWQWRRAEAQRRLAVASLADAREQRRRALQSLRGGAGALSSLLRLHGDGLQAPDSPPLDHPGLRSVIVEFYRDALREPLAADPDLRAAQASLAMGVMAMVHRTAPAAEALRAWEETQVVLERLLRDDPNELRCRDYLARSLGSQGVLLRGMGRLEEAAARLRRSLDGWRVYGTSARAGMSADPGHRSAREAWIGTLLDLASVELRLGRGPGWIARHREALALAEELLRESPDDRVARQRTAGVCAGLAWHIRRECPSEAFELYLRASELGKPPVVGDPADWPASRRWAGYLYELAAMEERLGRADEALRDFRRAVATFEALARLRSLDSGSRASLGASYHVIGRLLVDMGRPAEAIAMYRAAIAIREGVIRDEPATLSPVSDCAGSWNRLGEALTALGRIDEAVGAYRAGLAHQRQLRAREPGAVQHGDILDERLRRLTRLLMALGRSDEAVEVVLERKALRPDDPAAALGAAVELAGIAARARPDQPCGAAARNGSRRRSAALALGAIREAVRLAAWNSDRIATAGRPEPRTRPSPP